MYCNSCNRSFNPLMQKNKVNKPELFDSCYIEIKKDGAEYYHPVRECDQDEEPS